MNSLQLAALLRQGRQFLADTRVLPALSNSPQLQPEPPRPLGKFLSASSLRHSCGSVHWCFQAHS